MYTESYAGDWESILATMATVAAPQPTVHYIRNVGNRADQFGLTKQAKLTIGSILLEYAKDAPGKLDKDFSQPVIFDLADYGRMIVHNPRQAIVLFHTLTGESIFGGKLTDQERKRYRTVKSKKAH